MIGLPLTMLITLYCLLFFFFQRKPFSFLQNSIVFMGLTLVTTNFITILALNLDYIKTTENPLLFPSVLLYRDVIIPLLVLIFINGFRASFTIKSKILYFLIITACLNGMEALLLYFHVLEYTKWNSINAAAANCLFLIIGLWMGKMVLHVSKRSPKHESDL